MLKASRSRVNLFRPELFGNASFEVWPSTFTEFSTNDFCPFVRPVLMNAVLRLVFDPAAPRTQFVLRSPRNHVPCPP